MPPHQSGNSLDATRSTPSSSDMANWLMRYPVTSPLARISHARIGDVEAVKRGRLSRRLALLASRPGSVRPLRRHVEARLRRADHLPIASLRRPCRQERGPCRDRRRRRSDTSRPEQPTRATRRKPTSCAGLLPRPCARLRSVQPGQPVPCPRGADLAPVPPQCGTLSGRTGVARRLEGNRGRRSEDDAEARPTRRASRYDASSVSVLTTRGLLGTPRSTSVRTVCIGIGAISLESAGQAGGRCTCAR